MIVQPADTTVGSGVASLPGGLHPDSRIRDLLALVESGDFDLLSLDVFDTLVWRAVPLPADVFYLVGRELIRRRAVQPSSPVESFVRERINAENRAREKAPAREATLDEIYAEFPRGYLIDLAPADVARLEFEVEREVVRVNPDMRALLDRARARGMKTALVSDTYFSRAQILMLTAFVPDYLLISSEYRLSKRLGLHRHLIEESGVPPGRILHAGDNHAADVEGPGNFNLARYWFRRFPGELAGAIDGELPHVFSRRTACLTHHDAGMTSLRGRMAFQCHTDHERWGAAVLGPVMAGFRDWVVERCLALGIDHVLCLMREGRILKEAIDGAGAPLKTSEFYVSRFAVLKAAIFDGREEELERFVFRPTPQKAGRILEQLGLTARQVGGIDADTRLQPAAARTLIRRISHDPVLRGQVLASSRRARAGLLRHLQSMGLDPATRKVALVDLGYSGTIQGALQTILDREATGLVTHGLYLVTGAEVHRTQAVGCAAEGWLAANGQPTAMAHTFMRSPEFVEQSLMADCGSTIGHADDGRPILGDSPVSPGQWDQIRDVQSGLRKYLAGWKALREEAGLVPGDNIAALARAILIRSVARPTGWEVSLFGGWQHDQNFGSRRARGLTDVVDLHPWEATHMSALQLASLPHSRVYWPFGFAAGLGGNLVDAVAQIYLRTAEPGVFDAAHPVAPLLFCWDSGHGFNDRESALQEYRLNSRGRCWHRFSLRARDVSYRAFGVALGRPGEIVRLTGVRLRYQPEADEATAICVPVEEIAASGGEEHSAGLYRVTDDPCLFVAAAHAPASFTGTVDVDVFFTVIPGA